VPLPEAPGPRGFEPRCESAIATLGQIEDETERMLEAAAIIEEQLDAVGVS